MPICNTRLQGGRSIIDLFVVPDHLEFASMRAVGEIPEPRPVRLLVDTGASMTKIAEWVLHALGLLPVSTVVEHAAFSPGRPVEREVDSVQLFMAGAANGVLAWDLQVTSSAGLEALGVDGLLGRDILDQCLLIYNGPESHFSLAFDPPPKPS